ADRERLDRRKARGDLDTALELVLALEFLCLGGDEAEHHHLAFRQKAQRLEAARARGVVFEEIAVDLDLVEQDIGDRLLAGFPPAPPRNVAADVTGIRAVRRAAD